MVAADLAKRLSAQDVEVRVQALRDLCGASASDIVAHADAVCACLGDPDLHVRSAAAAALAAAGTAATPCSGKVAKLLSSASPGARCAAAEVLAALGADSHAAAVAGLLDEDATDCASAMHAGAAQGKPQDGQCQPRVAALQALPKLGPGGRAHAATIAKLLKDGRPEVRAAAATALGAMGGEGTAQGASLLATAQEGDRDPRAAAAAALALGQLARGGTPVPGSTEALAKLFESQHPTVRAGAATALGMLGDATLPHMAKLVKCLSDRSPQVKVAACAALASLGPAGQVYAANLGRLAHDSWQLPGTRAAALDGLALMGERGAALADDVADLLEDADDEVRAAAGRTLEVFGQFEVAYN